MTNLLEKIWRTKWIHALCFVLILSLLESFKIHLDITKTPETLGIILQLIIPLMTFFALIALFRLEGLRSLDTNKKEEFEKDIIHHLSTYGTRIAIFLFVLFLILLISVSNKSSFLYSEFKLHVDTVILSSLIVYISYILDGILSSLKKENLSSKS